MYYIYKILPVFFQNFLCSVYGLFQKNKRFNSVFYKELDLLCKSDFSSKKNISNEKKRLLSNSLLNAKCSGFYPSINFFEDSFILSNPYSILSQLPIITKNDLLTFDMTNISRLKGTQSVVTSGTTGKALTLVREADCFAIQWAVWFRHRARFGINLDDESVNFTGKPLVPLEQKKPPFWRYNAAQKQHLISMQHININTIGSIVGFLNSIKPKFYSGYPSIIAEVARLALIQNVTLDKDSRPSVIVMGAEKTLDYQVDAIRKWLGNDIVITDQYGLTEGNCNFSKCEFGHYHEDFEFCHIEIVDGETLPDGSTRGRLVGTTFYNKVLPLIRYDTGDIARIAPDDFQCPCGRNSRVILEVDGRVDDYILLPDGRHVMRFDYLFKDTFEALEAQVIQQDMDAITILAVLVPNADKNGFERKVEAHFREYIHSTMLLKFEYTDTIPKSNTGKFKAVINRLKHS